MTAIVRIEPQALIDKHGDKVRAVAAAGFDLRKLFRLAVSLSHRDAKLMEAIQAAPETFMRALQVAAKLGLEVDAGPLGGMHLVPRWNSKAQRREVTFVIDYRGLADLATRSGALVPGGLTTRVVYERDEFKPVQGTEESIRHVPYLGPEDPGEIVAFYAVARCRDGSSPHEILRRSEVDALRDRFNGDKSFSPWSTDYAAMGRKTAARRVLNLVPKSVNLAVAIQSVAAEEAGDLEVLAGHEDTLDLPPIDPNVRMLESRIEQPKPRPEAPAKRESVAEAKAKARSQNAASMPKPPAAPSPSEIATDPNEAPPRDDGNTHRALQARLAKHMNAQSVENFLGTLFDARDRGDEPDEGLSRSVVEVLAKAGKPVEQAEWSGQKPSLLLKLIEARL